MRQHILSLLIASLGLGVAPAFGQATWTTHGTGTAYDMSDDGLSVAGEDGGNAFVWTMTGGQADLGETNARGVSDDGSIVAGNITDMMGNSAAGRYASGAWTSLGGLGGMSGTSLSTTYAMDADGSTVVGLGWIDAGTAGAFRWTQATGMVPLPQMGPNSSRANAVSDDGTWVGGWDEAATGPRRAAIWDPTDTETLIAITATNPEGLGEAWGFSQNNSYVAGSTEGEGFVWDATNGLTKTGALPSMDFFALGEGYGVSNSGNRVVGFYRVAFPFDNRATIWTPGGGLEELKGFLEAQGATGVPNLTVAYDISGDGTRILASGGGVWGIATLPPECGGSDNFCVSTPNSTGMAALISSNGLFDVSANMLQLTASPVPNDNGIFFYGANQVQVPFENGFRCVGGPPLHRLAIETATGNVLSHDVDFTNPPAPSGMITGGSTWNFQAWFRDPSAGGAFVNLSDGLEITFCD